MCRFVFHYLSQFAFNNILLFVAAEVIIFQLLQTILLVNFTTEHAVFIGCLHKAVDALEHAVTLTNGVTSRLSC